MLLVKRCSNSQCRTFYKENDKEYQEDLCICGNLLIEIEVTSIDGSDFNIEEVLGVTITTPSTSTTEYKDEEVTTKNEELSDNYSSENKTFIKRPVVKMTLDELQKSNTVQYSVDSKGYIHFEETTTQEELNEDKVVIYLGGQIYKEIPIEYDETIVGRYSINSEPDVDLSDIDTEGYTSRRHLMIYKEQDKYFARNLSAKNSVHINAKALIPNTDKELQDNDIIVLSRYIVMEFKLKK